jgi:hypothetical protein
MENKKVFIDARYGSSVQQYIRLAPLFLAPIGIFYFFFKAIKYSDVNESGLSFFLLALSFFLCAFLLVFFINGRKYWTFKIITNNTGIIFIGLFKKVNALWDEVISVNVASKESFFGGTVIEVMTKRGNFRFPLRMKEKEKIYPKLRLEFKGEKWVFENGNEEGTTLENCPLYVEIQKHLGNK